MVLSTEKRRAGLALSTLLALAIALPSGMVKATEDADRILGIYLNEKQNAKIEIYREGLKYFGRIVWHKNPRKDHYNPDPVLRDRSLVGLVFLKNFVWDAEEREWNGGEVYAPDDGNTYGGYLWLEEGFLKMHGYIGIPLFGRTATMTPLD